MAGYQDIVAARRDFDGLVELVKAKTVKVEGVILVAHDQDGNVTVVDTGDHVGRKGAGWGAGVGLVVGCSRRRCSLGGRWGRWWCGGGQVRRPSAKAGIRDKIGEALPPGSAGIIAVLDDDQRLAFEQALPGARLKSVVQSDKHGLVRGLKASLAEAMGKFSRTARNSRSGTRTSVARSGGRWMRRWRTGPST